MVLVGDRRGVAGSGVSHRPVLSGDTISGMIGTMPWSVETLNETVDAELAELPPDMRARLVRTAELIASLGLPNVKEPHVRHIRGRRWEIRLKGGPALPVLCM